MTCLFLPRRIPLRKFHVGCGFAHCSDTTGTLVCVCGDLDVYAASDTAAKKSGSSTCGLYRISLYPVCTPPRAKVRCPCHRCTSTRNTTRMPTYVRRLNYSSTVILQPVRPDIVHESMMVHVWERGWICSAVRVCLGTYCRISARARACKKTQDTIKIRDTHSIS